MLRYAVLGDFSESERHTMSANAAIADFAGIADFLVETSGAITNATQGCAMSAKSAISANVGNVGKVGNIGACRQCEAHGL